MLSKGPEIYFLKVSYFESKFTCSHLNQKPNELFFDLCPKDLKWVKKNYDPILLNTP